ncbi:M20 family metallopeptidase [Methylacidiphilum caldifontis]|uniref:Probable succinyl-diaminopimelate desuccinylase n=1 Tax=Methylacidiphilum caldifontis TaxID=2795386 RepID=A0A4Y8PHK1_9BACT|nr:ArgE/DapE family deacylase [Methylacidiphilum caldifontis]QSR88323.1 ArgE/DapE family deacylase [Methylacidiphilum caldifontis]TFE70634.1 acetylornithine deacetylase [Methylacidiphilum caldifontis]
MPNETTEWISKNRERLFFLLENLIRIPTVNPPGEKYLEIVEFLDKEFRRLGLDTQIIAVPDEIVKKQLGTATYPRYNFIARWNIKAQKTVLFNSHFDVVPVSGKWRHDPFKGYRDEKWIFGRGSVDMKGPLAASIFAIEAIKELKIDPVFNVEYALVADEEIGGELGSGYIIKNKFVDPDFVIVCEGGLGKKIGIGHNGILQLNITVLGKASHTAYQEKALNSFLEMVNLVEYLEGFFKKKIGEAKRVFITPSREKLRPIVNMGGVISSGAGAKINIVSAQSSFTLDRRLTPSENLEEVEKEIRDAIGKWTKKRGTKVRIEVIHRTEPCAIGYQSAFTKSFKRAVEKIKGKKAVFTISKGATDMHFFVKEKNCEAVGYGVDGKDIHAIDEKASLDDLVKTAQVYAEFLCSPCP